MMKSRRKQLGFGGIGPAFFAGGAATSSTAWDTAGATANFTANPTFWLMTNSNRTCTPTASATVKMCMRGTTPAKTTGKWYFECLHNLTGVTGVHINFGLISSAATMTDDYQTGSGKGDVTYRSNSQCFTNGVGTYNGTDGSGAWPDGLVLGFAIDVGNTLYIYRSNALVFTLALATASVLPYLAYEAYVAGLAGTLRTTAANCTYLPPAGFSNWD